MRRRFGWHANSDADPANLWLRNLLQERASAVRSNRAKARTPG
jgi:hypothetical protein